MDVNKAEEQPCIKHPERWVFPPALAHVSFSKRIAPAYPGTRQGANERGWLKLSACGDVGFAPTIIQPLLREKRCRVLCCGVT
jgi:hypothetical protein